MNPLARLLLIIALFAAPALAAGPATQPTVAGHEAQHLADAVVKASGIDAWPTISHLRFTFNVADNGKTLMSAEHDWDVPNHKDTVTWGGKTVTVDTKTPGDSPEQKAAFQRWTNDSYWLLAPLKLKDPGVLLSYDGTRQVDGKTYEVLHMKFDAVGLTSHDQYDLYIDPATWLLARWTYRPAPDKQTSGTWEDYQDVAGLKLATNHHFGGKRVFFTNVTATTK
jgi:hypothetical protein